MTTSLDSLSEPDFSGVATVTDSVPPPADDEPPARPVSIAPPSWPRGAEASDAEEFFARVAEDHRELSGGLAALREVVADLSGRLGADALLAIRTDLAALIALRGALAKVYFCATDTRLAAIAGSTTNLGAYLGGLYTATKRVYRALEGEVAALGRGETMERTVARAASEAKELHFACLFPAVRADVAAHASLAFERTDPLAGVTAHLDELFVCAGWLEGGPLPASAQEMLQNNA